MILRKFFVHVEYDGTMYVYTYMYTVYTLYTYACTFQSESWEYNAAVCTYKDATVCEQRDVIYLR